MGMVVKNNMSAVRTLNTLNSNTSALQKSLQKVSSGMKINSAQDDASGYAISERMRVRIRSLDQANQNSQNDSSLMKTAEGAVGNTVEILRALKEKAINAANDSNTDEDRQTIQKEINQFIDQIDDNALVQFNGKYLVDGSKNNAFYETKSILLNQSLKTGTSSQSALTDLYNRAGDSLGIQTTDKYQVSWVQNGTVNFTSGDVGTKAISDILTITPEGASDPISQVKATTKGGLISGANEEDESNVQYLEEPLSYVSGDESTFKDIITKAEAYYVEQHKDDSPAPTEIPVDGTGSVNISELKDSDGRYFFAADSDGGVFDAQLVKDTNGSYKIEQGGQEIDNETKIYVANPDYVAPTNTTDLALASKTTIEDETSTTKNTFNKTLAKECYDSGKFVSVNGADFTTDPVNVNDSTTGFTKVATMKLSDIQAKDAESNLVKDDKGNAVSKYYFKVGDEFIAASDVTVTRTQTWKNNDGSDNAGKPATLLGDAITFTSASVDLTTATLYEYNPNYSTEESGLDKAWDKFGKAVYTPDKTMGIAFGATEADVDHQISGLTISILDQDGNVKKAANAALDQFKQYQRAENETGDMSLNFHIGSEANVAFKVGMGDMRAQALGLKGSDGTRIDVYTKEHANAAINVIENALTKALDQQTTIGAIEARLEYTSTNLTTSSENVQAAESTIRDADMAKEMTNYTKSNVLLQAAQAMLAQANQNSSAVLSLLQ